MDKVFSDRRDTFSFGVLLWALMAGTKPWPDSNSLEAARAHCAGKRLPLPGGPLSDGGLGRIMQRCWAQKADQRPPVSEVRVYDLSF